MDNFFDENNYCLELGCIDKEETTKNGKRRVSFSTIVTVYEFRYVNHVDAKLLIDKKENQLILPYSDDILLIIISDDINNLKSSGYLSNGYNKQYDWKITSKARLRKNSGNNHKKSKLETGCTVKAIYDILVWKI